MADSVFESLTKGGYLKDLCKNWNRLGKNCANCTVWQEEYNLWLEHLPVLFPVNTGAVTREIFDQIVLEKVLHLVFQTTVIANSSNEQALYSEYLSLSTRSSSKNQILSQCLYLVIWLWFRLLGFLVPINIVSYYVVTIQHIAQHRDRSRVNKEHVKSTKLSATKCIRSHRNCINLLLERKRVTPIRWLLFAWPVRLVCHDYNACWGY